MTQTGQNTNNEAEKKVTYGKPWSRGSKLLRHNLNIDMMCNFRRRDFVSRGESGTCTWCWGGAWPWWWPPSCRGPGGTRRGTAAIWGKPHQASAETKTFLETSISPVLASSGCYLGAAGQSSVGLVAVAAMPGKPSAGESPLSGCTTVLPYPSAAPLLSTVLSCCTLATRSLVIHTR